MYLNTGTLSAYAVTLQNPFVMEGYIVNYDYKHYLFNYHFILGDAPETWTGGLVLRRVLFYFLAFPFLKLFGLYTGGFIAASLITLISIYHFIKFVYVNFSVNQAYIAMALLCSYPGIMYWIGSPFSQIMIVPCCCLIYILMWKINQTINIKDHVLYLLVIAILFTAYDLFIFFYPAILIIYFRKAQWKQIILSIPIVVLPQLIVMIWLIQRGALELGGGNVGLYATIVNSYLKPQDLSSWNGLIIEAPKILVYNFFDSNFLFLPLLFLVLIIWGRFKKENINNIEGSILFSALVVFLFNNLAPYYFSDFQMRGEWIARIYQPIFIVLIMYVVRFSNIMFEAKGLQWHFFIGLIVCCLAGNLIINFGGCLKSNFTQWAWYRFYQHSDPGTMQKNLKTYGVRPIGFPDHEIKGLQP